MYKTIYDDLKKYSYLADTEMAKAEAFLDLHECDSPFRIEKDTSSGIGIGYDIVCEKCGIKYDITDYGRW